ncbi:MAG: MopE-related protein, partial [Planctomycetaceae bacterium]
SDFNIHPGAPELLNGIDDDCDEDIDEDFNGSDSDGDGLLDLDEFNIYNTNPFDDDTDDDGLFDGEEINQTFTDPLVPDLDADGDGFRWFEECNDEDSAIRPDAFELWNGIDDDCDDEIDGGVNRSESTRFWPEMPSPRIAGARVCEAIQAQSSPGRI